jgi:hypothetical protein
MDVVGHFFLCPSVEVVESLQQTLEFGRADNKAGWTSSRSYPLDNEQRTTGLLTT